MAIIDPDRAYPDEARYWAMVEDTIVVVFDRQREDALRLVKDLVRVMADAPPAERLLSFHNEPYQVAASLLRLDVDASPEERQRYHDLAVRSGWSRSPPTKRAAVASAYG